MNKVNFDQRQLEKAHNRNLSQKLVKDLNLNQNEIDERFKYYFSIPQPPQKSQEWLNQRTNYITASAFGNAIAPKWSSHRNELLKNKVSCGKYNSFKGNEATRWGEKYEDVANAIYCYRQNVTVEEFGLIPHPDFPFLGASTDGISSKLINLEIKCPFSRKIKPGEVKPIYWKQMQLQMAVLDLELSHFLECTFQEYPSERDFWIDFNFEFANKERGIIIELVDYNVTNLVGEPKTTYQYSPIELCENEDQLRLWHKQSISKMISNPNQIYVRSHFWILPVCSCVNVIRDREWFNAQIPKFVEFWEDVKRYREMTFEELEADIEKHKPKKVKNTPIKIDTTSLKLSDDSNELPRDYIMSSSDEELEDDQGKKGGCIMDSSSEEDDFEEEQRSNNSSPKPVLNLTPKSSPEKKKTPLTREALETLIETSSNNSAGSIYDHESQDKKRTRPKKKEDSPIRIDLSDDEQNYQADNEVDDDSSGSDDTDDTPPLRPPSKTIYYRKRKKSGDSSNDSNKSRSRSSREKQRQHSPETMKLDKHTVSLKLDD